jgi:RES domain-containing protein
LIQIDVPDATWNSRTIIQAASLPVDWNAIPESSSAIAVGTEWYEAGETAILELPSVIVPEETIVLINATHKDAKQIHATLIRKYEYNALFRNW